MGGEFSDPATGEFVSAAGRGNPGVEAQGEKKANSGSFACKPLISFKTAKTNPWKKLGNPWKNLGKVWKSLEKFGIPWKSLGALRQRGASFLAPKGAL
jgi:hypothetical protein